ncbi:MAG: S1C family serine protease [Nocardioides sp.]
MTDDHADTPAPSQQDPAWTPYGYSPPAPTAAFPSQPSTPSAGRPERRTGARTIAGVAATALLIGGGAGIGGAAWYVDHHGGSANGGSVTTSSVVNEQPQPAVSGSVPNVAQKVLPSVVEIRVSGAQESGSGSGIILSSDGNILTNNHVVAIAGNNGNISVSFNDGSTTKARIVGTDPLTDTAVIKAEGVSGLQPATIGKSSSLQVGQAVVAIGSPFGLESTVTSGIVSALNRPVDVGSDSSGNATVYPAIQTDAAINPGNSGGALVDSSGNVVGINASIQSTTSSSAGGQAGSIGLGFAIPIDEVLPVVQQMLHGQTPTHARLGISVRSIAGQSSAATGGAKVDQVNAGSTAQGAGLKSGDVITKVDNQLITSSDSLIATIRSYRPGDKVSVTYTRGGTPHTVTLALDSDAANANS